MTVRQRYTVEDVATPSATLSTVPQETVLDLGWCVLNRIDLRIPPGPSGLAGVSIVQAGTQLWPWGELDTWIVGDDEQYNVDINVEIDAGISILTYNTDVYSHTMYFKFLYTPIALVTVPSLVSAVVPVF